MKKLQLLTLNILKIVFDASVGANVVHSSVVDPPSGRAEKRVIHNAMPQVYWLGGATQCSTRLALVLRSPYYLLVSGGISRQNFSYDRFKVLIRQ